MSAEIELKLSARAGALADAQTHPALAALRSGDARTIDLVSTYYDTAAGELRQRGVSLRTRRSDSVWLQTVKGAGNAVAGLHTRQEFEWPIPGPRVDARRLATTPWARDFVATSGRLRALFKTEISRVEVPIAFADGTRATVCLDAGTIRAGGKKVPVSEIEIELIDGNVARLYELALALAADLPLSIATSSKADRGFALAWSRAPQPLRASRIAMARGISTEAALTALGRECLAQIGTNAEAVAAGIDDEFLHQLRVGVRRLRSLLRLVASLTSKDAVAGLTEELQWLTSLLGPARDWDVFATETLATMAPHIGHPQLRREAGRLRSRVTRMRGLYRRAAMDAVGSSRFTRLMLSAGMFFTTLHVRGPDGAQPAPDACAFAQSMLARCGRALRRRGKRLRHASATERHQTRIAAKKLRYAAEFFATLFSGRRAPNYIKALSRLQTVLGRLNDLATAERLLDQVAPLGATTPTLAHSAGMARGWIAASERFELERIGKTWNTFARLKPFWN